MAERPARQAVMEIGALLGDAWTGIPIVAAGLADAALRDPEIDWSFMVDTIEVPRPLVAHILASRSGAAAREALATQAWERGEIPRALADRVPGLYTNIKPARRFFAREAMLIYDLSPLLTPQFHDAAAISWFADHIRGDIATSEHLFCTSRATRDDVRHYFAVPAERMSVIRPGVAFDPADLSAARLATEGLRCEPYVAIVGTMEPRKNGRIVLEHLARDPGFADRYRIVFIGRDGWLSERERLLDAVTAAGIARERVMFTGYVAEREKLALMLNAAFCIYPSFFEGYGLPVLEAAALGRLTVCSDRTAMPEVAPESCLFFDPLDGASFARALAAAEARLADPGDTLSLDDLIARAAALSPDRAYPPIARWVSGG